MKALRSLRIFAMLKNNRVAIRNEKSIERFDHSRAVADAEKTENKNILQWEICAAVCLTRLPIVSPALNEMEEKYLNLLENEEYEKSVLSDWEVEKQRQEELIRAIEFGEKTAKDMDFKVTNQDIEDEYETKSKSFTPAEKLSSSSSDMNSVNRKMDESLIYIINKKLGNDAVWLLPTCRIKEGETLRECAERALTIHRQQDFSGKILSNAPSGFIKYKFPKEVRTKKTVDCVGAKVFIYPALLIDDVQAYNAQNEFTEETGILNSAWATKDELAKYLKPKYFKALEKMLP